MCKLKLDFNDSYFSVRLNKDSKKMIRFRCSDNLYEFVCLCFGLGSPPRTFTKFLRVPISIIRRLTVRVVIQLDNMLLFRKTSNKVIMAKDTVIFLLNI